MRSVLILIAAVLALLPPPSFASEMLAEHEGDSVRLTQKPCAVSVLQVIPEGSRGYFLLALTMIDGKEYLACWATRTDGMVFIQYADGDGGLIPMQSFSVVPDA